MSKFRKIILSPVFFIVTLAFLLRITNPTFGSPVLYVVPDEVLNYMAALTMLKEKTLMTTSQYPPFGSYIQLPFLILSYFFIVVTQKVTSLNDFLFFLATHEGAFLFISRIISAVFGTASLIVLLHIGRLIFPQQKAIGLWAMLITGFSITHLQISSLGKPNMPALFFYCVGIYFVVKSVIQKTSVLKNQFFSLLFFSLGSGFHMSSMFGVAIFLLIYGIFYHKQPLGHRANVSTMILLLIPLSFFIGYLLLSTGAYHPTLPETLGVLQYNLSWGLHHVFYFYIKELILTEPFLTIFLGVSFFSIRRWPKIFFPLALFSLLYTFYIIASFYHSLRYFLPVLAIWSLFAAFTLDNILNRITIGKQLVIACLLGLLIFPAGLWAYRFSTLPTFIVAKSWIENHILPQIPVASTAIRFSAFIPDRDTRRWIRQKNPAAYSLAETVLTGEKEPENVRAIVYLDQVIDMKDYLTLVSFIREHEIKYLIQPYWNPEDRLALTRTQDFILTKRFSPVPDNDDRVVKNVLHGSGDITELLRISRFGPYIDILEINTGR